MIRVLFISLFVIVAETKGDLSKPCNSILVKKLISKFNFSIKS